MKYLVVFIGIIPLLAYAQEATVTPILIACSVRAFAKLFRIPMEPMFKTEFGSIAKPSSLENRVAILMPKM
ncbi:hypothetical protein L596_000980 [Steinernema carpocapsae]|uniref:Uncharacterized protein n=1 Tax=Steinernema carpocapsae TaxID=34508 RepID=A0A4U8UM69_STECR|nr:hypothetical protein L596_000980 [Steinernema carpocapsae]